MDKTEVEEGLETIAASMTNSGGKAGKKIRKEMQEGGQVNSQIELEGA